MKILVYVGMTLLGLLIGFGAGYVTGRESAAEPEDPSWDTLEPGAGRGRTRREPSELTTPTAGSSSLEPDTVARPQPREGRPESATDEVERTPFLIRIFDRDGAVLASSVAVPVASPFPESQSTLCLLVPGALLAGAHAATVEVRGGSLQRTEKVVGRVPRAGLALLAFAGSTPAWPLREGGMAPDSPVWLVAPDSPGVRRPARAEGTIVPAGQSLEWLGLDVEAAGEFGAAVLDESLALAGLVPPATANATGSSALIVTTDLLRGAERLELPLAEYTRLFYEGTADALLREARKHLGAKRYDPAIRAFRAAFQRDPNVAEAARGELLAAHRGRLAGVSAVTAPGRRISYLRDALTDFPRSAEFLVELARMATAEELYAEAIEAYDRAWREDPEQVGPLNPLKASVYLKWIKRLQAAGRIDAAVGVAEEALRDVRDNADLWELYGRLLLRVRDYPGTIAALQEAILLDARREIELERLIVRAERLSAGPGKVVIDYPPGSRSILTTVEVNGVAGEFIIDTGATSSFVPLSVAEAGGLDTSHRVPRRRVRTAGGERTLPYSPVDELRVGDLAVRGISVIVGDLPGMEGRGLLGMDFLGSFGFENDSANGRFVIFEKP